MGFPVFPDSQMITRSARSCPDLAFQFFLAGLGGLPAGHAGSSGAKAKVQSGSAGELISRRSGPPLVFLDQLSGLFWVLRAGL